MKDKKKLLIALPLAFASMWVTTYLLSRGDKKDTVALQRI